MEAEIWMLHLCWTPLLRRIQYLFQPQPSCTCRTPFEQARDDSRLFTRLLRASFTLCARLVLMGAMALYGAFRYLDGGRRRNAHRVFQPHKLSDGASWGASALGLCPTYQVFPGLWAVLILLTVAVHAASVFSDTLSLTIRGTTLFAP